MLSTIHTNKHLNAYHMYIRITSKLYNAFRATFLFTYGIFFTLFLQLNEQSSQQNIPCGGSALCEADLRCRLQCNAVYIPTVEMRLTISFSKRRRSIGERIRVRAEGGIFVSPAPSLLEYNLFLVHRAIHVQFQRYNTNET